MGENTATVVRSEEGGDYRGKGMSRPYPYVGKYSTVLKRCTVCRVFEREKFIDDLRPTCESEIQVWEPTLLVSRVLCRYRRTEQGTDNGVHT